MKKKSWRTGLEFLVRDKRLISRSIALSMPTCNSIISRLKRKTERKYQRQVRELKNLTCLSLQFLNEEKAGIRRSAFRF